MDKPRVVVCAANRYIPTGHIVCSARHYDDNMIKQMYMSHIPWKDSENIEQGFIDQFGVFMNRKEAWRVAERAEQIKYRCGGDGKKLFSENLY
jgi:hypothetical protein